MFGGCQKLNSQKAYIYTNRATTVVNKKWFKRPKL